MLREDLSRKRRCLQGEIWPLTKGGILIYLQNLNLSFKLP
jgi:hypothetical protein